MAKRLAKDLRVGATKAKEVHEAALKLMAAIGSYFAAGQKPVNELIFVPLLIMSRIVRTHEAIALLLKNEHHAEAAVLALTQFELRFDLLWVASDIRRATQWVEHDDPQATASRMKAKLDGLFRPAEARRQYETFGYLSGIKHGNPLYSELGFPGRGRRARLVVSTRPFDDVVARAFCEAVFAYSTYQLAWAAQVVNKLIAQYAIVDAGSRRAVQDHYLGLRPVDRAFRLFLKRRVAARKTLFGMKGRLQKSRTRGREDGEGSGSRKA